MHIYVSFFDRDRKLVDELDVHLKPMQRLGEISFWHRGKAVLTSPLAEQMERELVRADIVLAFVSPRYNADDDCERELRAAVDAGKRPIPILAEQAELKGTYFDGKVPLPRDNKPLARRPDLDSALVTIVQEIRGMIKNVPVQPSAPAPAPVPWPPSAQSPSVQSPSTQSPHASAPNGILEMVPFPWSDPRAQSLHRHLVKAYPRRERAHALAAEAGVEHVAINWDQPVAQIWRDLLDLAASSSLLAALVTRALEDPLSAAYVSKIRDAIRPATLP